jgi:hypothetical protein
MCCEAGGRELIRVLYWAMAAAGQERESLLLPKLWYALVWSAVSSPGAVLPLAGAEVQKQLRHTEGISECCI